MMKKCKICHKSVYPLDPQINLDGSLFHKGCAKCEDCATQITTANFRKYENGEFVTLVCEVHYNARIVDRGALWYTSEVRERERIAGTIANQDAANRRGSLAVLSGAGLVQAVAPVYVQPPSPQYSIGQTGKVILSSPNSSKLLSSDQLESIPTETSVVNEVGVESIQIFSADENIDVDGVSSVVAEVNAKSEIEQGSLTDANPEPEITIVVPSSTSYHVEMLVEDSSVIELRSADDSFGRLDPRSIALAEKLGTKKKHENQFESAEYFYREVLNRRRDLYGENHPDSINGISMLADLLHKMRKLPESVEMYRSALSHRESLQGMDHVATLYEVNDLACVLCRMKQFDEAEALYKRALSSRERVLGANHEDTLITAHDYAALLEETDRLSESEHFYLRAVSGREASLGRDHSDTIDSITCLALLLQNMEKYSDAEAMYLRAMDACERAHGATDKHTCDMAFNLGSMYEDQGEFEKSVEMYEYALHGYSVSLGADDEETVEVAEKLSAIRSKL